jgi:photosystem II stability/assembly factor-like uncharacterized protein
MRFASRLASAAFAVGLAALLVVNVGSADAAAQVAPQPFIASLAATPVAPQSVNLDAVLAGVHYREIGPTRQSGRFVSIAADPRDTNTFYAASASGGLWKTHDGVHFESVFNMDDVFSIGAVAVAPSAPDTVWVGTGEGNNSRSVYWGNGIYKSTDAGMTWQHMGLPDSGHIGRIVVHPTNPNIVYVAVLGQLYSDNPERGLYKTTDGGRTWNQVLTDVIEPTGRLQNETTRHIGVVDVALHPNDPDTLYAATYDKVRRPWTFNEAGPGSRIYKSTNGGDDWTMLEGGLPMGMLGRIGLAVTPDSPDTVYAVIEDVNVDGMSDDERYQLLLNGAPAGRDNNDRVWRSDDSGATWQAVSPADQNVGGGPPYYYGQIIVDPNDVDTVFVLSAGSYKSTDGGQTWGRAWTGIGGDDHVLWIDPSNSDYMLLGYDHGLGVSRDGGNGWYHPDDLPLAQFYAIGLDNAYPYNVYGGIQDNGSKRGPSRTRSGRAIDFEEWERVGGGDGMYNVVDWSNNRYLYNSSQFAGGFGRLDLLTGESGGGRYSRPEGQEELRWNWLSPVVVSPHDANVLYMGSNVVLRSSYRAETWEEISPDLTTNDPAKIQGTGNIQYCTIVSLDESPIVAGLLWAGTDDGNVWVSKDTGANWTQLNSNVPGNPGYWVSRIEPSNHDPAVAYLSYTGFRRDDFRPFLYKTTDYGATWTAISAGLPNASINVIREDHRNGDLLFVGNELGVWVSLDGGGSWHEMKGDLPTVPVHDIQLQERDNDMVVGTHGRGAFVTDISWLQELSAATLAQPAHLFDVETAVRWHATDRSDASSQNFGGGAAQNGSVINYLLASPASTAPIIRIYDGDRMVRELTGTNEAGLNSVTWDMDFGRARTPTEQAAFEAAMRGRGGRGGFGGFGGRGGRNPNRPADNVYQPAPEGTYRVVLMVNGQSYETTATVLDDHWWDKQF